MAVTLTLEPHQHSGIALLLVGYRFIPRVCWWVGSPIVQHGIAPEAQRCRVVEAVAATWSSDSRLRR